MTLKQIWAFSKNMSANMSLKGKTFLALNLIAIIFAISCGAKSTKPENLKASLYESERGTKLYTNATASSNTAIDVSTFAGTGENVTAINSIKLTNADGTYSNVDFTTVLNSAGEVYSFTPTGLTASSRIIVSYNYYKKALTTNNYRISTTPTFQDFTTNNVYANGVAITNEAFILGRNFVFAYQSGPTTWLTNSTDRITNEGQIIPPSISLPVSNVIFWVY